MSSEEAVGPGAAERLSALMDGEMSESDVAALCGAWRDDASMRESWHRYHLIGDVLRSDDLAAGATEGAAFLGRLRARLEAEPVVLAPAPLPAPARARRWRWAGPAAVAAGFAAVAVVLVVTRAPQGDEASSPPLADAKPAAPVVRTVAAPAVAALPEAEETVANPKMLRDARLDRYLEAHQQFGSTTALGSSMLHRAALEAAQR